jgi:hypothetical protein
LPRHGAALFRRLELFVLARRGSADQVLAVLVDPKLADQVAVWHEYSELLKARFGDLDPDRQLQIIAVIDDGPERELSDEQEERGLTEEDIETRRRYWRLERYALISGHLDGAARVAYESLRDEFGGDPEHPTFHTVITSWSGPTSPFSVQELSEMGPERVGEELRAWEPTGGSEDPSREGLGRILQETVEKDAARYAAVATEFADLNAHYVVGLLGGLAKAVKEGARIPWEPVLALCETAVARSNDNHEPRDRDEDPPSRWLRRTIGGLLSDGLENGLGEIPAAERSRVWVVIEILLGDPDPMPDREEGASIEAATLAINTVRGEATHAVMRYALWVERALGESFGGMASVPEVAAAIDRHLDPAFDASLAIRAVFGQWFVQLVRMDEEWAASLVPRLFPVSPEDGDFFAAAWNAYVVFNRPWIPVFRILEEGYGLAIDHLDQVEEDRTLTGSPRERLGEHLFFLRIVGTVGLEEDGLFVRFWSQAPEEVRIHVLRDAGWSLEHGDPTMLDETRERFEETWEWIASREEGEKSALGAFGAWFGASQLDDDWLLAQGRRILELGIQLDPDFNVFSALPRMVAAYPREVIELLRLMVITDQEGWAVLGSLEEVHETLSAALVVGDEVTRSETFALIDLLGAKGVRDFRNLVPPG